MSQRPETTIAVLPCEKCQGWVRHAYVKTVGKMTSGGGHVHNELIFACAAGHERVWGALQ